VQAPAQATRRRALTRNERRRAQTRARLLAAGRKLFAAQGFEQTTIRDIAGDADTALGSFYNHFGTKEDVLAALLEDAWESSSSSSSSARTRSRTSPSV
jgi:AcrR family transcriptional regulator